jgi:signal transduction histidine kinase
VITASRGRAFAPVVTVAGDDGGMPAPDRQPSPSVAGSTVSGPGRAPVADPRPEMWARWIVGWHVAFWGLVSLVALRLASASDLPARQRWIAGGAVLALCLAYAVAVQPNWTRDPRGAVPGTRRLRYAYLCVAFVVVGVVCAQDASLSMLMFIAFPQAWMLSSSYRAGVGFTTAVTASALIGFLVRYGYSVDVIRQIGPSMLVSLLFSLLLGTWIARVIEQSQERAQLIGQLEAARTELAAADHARGVMAERERLAREIHDTLAQGFTSIVMLAQAAAAALPTRPDQVDGQLATIEDVARENLAEARALVSAYTPVALEGSTLADAVRRLVERFGRETGLQVDLEIGAGVARLTRTQEVVALRVAQEALTNVRRHARAQRVSVRLVAEGQGGYTRVEVGDDGIGFGPEPDAAGGGFGLAGIRGRVSQVGGQLEVASTPGTGTRVTVLLPGTEPGSEPGDEPGSAPGGGPGSGRDGDGTEGGS